MDNSYIVRFIRKDGKPVEEFFYHTFEAAIRAEDIAKGVFVPVSQLPAKEPKKGVQTA